jgi:hypothetical protein
MRSRSSLRPLGQSPIPVQVLFKHSDAVLFQASNCQISSIANLQTVANEIIARFRQGKWAFGEVVITELVTARAATILISNGQNARIDLAIKAQASANKATLLDTEAKIDVARASGIGTRIVAAAGLTPLFKANGIKKIPFRDPKLVIKDIDEVHFFELEYKDTL